MTVCALCPRRDLNARGALAIHMRKAHGVDQRARIRFRCEHCGREVDYPRGDGKTDRLRFCSTACAGAARRASPAKCAGCGMSVVREPGRRSRRVFCSRDCAARTTGREKRGRAIPVRRRRTLVPCATCARSVEKLDSIRRRRANLFCSQACANRWLRRRGGFVGAHVGPLTDFVRDLIGDEHWDVTRRRLRPAALGPCESCGRRPLGDGVHDLHHIVPILAGGSNDSDNLMALCEYCHPRVEAFTARVCERVLVHALNAPVEGSSSPRA